MNKTLEDLGMSASSAYIKVEHFSGTKDVIHFVVKVYYNEQARLDEKEPLHVSAFSIPTPTTDLLPALYAHLKGLEEFSGSVDV